MIYNHYNVTMAKNIKYNLAVFLESLRHISFWGYLTFNCSYPAPYNQDFSSLKIKREKI